MSTLRWVSVTAILMSLAALAACSSPTSVRDTGTPVRDTGTPVRDTETPVRDAATPVSDAGTKGNVFYLAERHSGQLVTLISVGSDSCREFQQEGGTCSLVVLCGSGILSVFTQTDERQTSGVVTYRIEEHRPVTETWQFPVWDTEPQRVALYSPAPERLLEELRGASRFSIQTSATPELSFDVRDLFNTPVQPNLDHCGDAGWD